MPRYPFRCAQCGTEFEVSRKMTENTTEADCPNCSAAAVRVFTAPLIGGRASEAPSVPAAPPAQRGHGHSHGPGGHHH